VWRYCVLYVCGVGLCVVMIKTVAEFGWSCVHCGVCCVYDVLMCYECGREMITIFVCV